MGLMHLSDMLHHHHSTCYVYKHVQPVLDDHGTEGALMVVTDRDPNEAWLAHVDQVRAHRALERIGGVLDDPPTLGVADQAYALLGHWPEQVLTFPKYDYF